MQYNKIIIVDRGLARLRLARDDKESAAACCVRASNAHAHNTNERRCTRTFDLSKRTHTTPVLGEYEAFSERLESETRIL